MGAPATKAREATPGRFNAAIATLLAGIESAQVGSAANPDGGVATTDQTGAIPSGATTPQAAPEPTIAPGLALPEQQAPTSGQVQTPAPAVPNAAPPKPTAASASAERGQGTPGTGKPKRRSRDDATNAPPPRVEPTAAAAVPPILPPADPATGTGGMPQHEPAAQAGVPAQPLPVRHVPASVSAAAEAASFGALPATSETAGLPAPLQRPISDVARPAPEATHDDPTPVEPHPAAVQAPNLPSGPSPPRPTARSAGSTAAPSPAAQLTPALVSIVHNPHGAQHLTVHLEPAELGHVEVRVDRSAGSPVRVDVTVQRPETLSLLLRDQSQLQHALDQAGLPADGRSVTFHIAPPVLTPAAATTHGGDLAGGAGGGFGGGTHAGFGGQHAGTPHWTPAPDDEASDQTHPALSRWLRAGIDITA